MRVSLARFLLILCLALGIGQLGQVAYYHAKAWVAGKLIARAWQETLQGAVQARPWPWADTWPVAAIEVPRLAVKQIVLSGDNGSVLAFAPGQTEHSQTGLDIISAHRDTHFRFLQQLQVGDEIILRKPGNSVHYQIQSLTVVDQRDFQIDPGLFYDQQEPAMVSLMLVTCFPFDGLRAGGHERFIVLAEAKI